MQYLCAGRHRKCQEIWEGGENQKKRMKSQKTFQYLLMSPKIIPEDDFGRHQFP